MIFLPHSQPGRQKNQTASPFGTPKAKGSRKRPRRALRRLPRRRLRRAFGLGLVPLLLHLIRPSAHPPLTAPTPTPSPARARRTRRRKATGGLSGANAAPRHGRSWATASRPLQIKRPRPPDARPFAIDVFVVALYIATSHNHHPSRSPRTARSPTKPHHQGHPHMTTIAPTPISPAQTPDERGAAPK